MISSLDRETRYTPGMLTASLRAPSEFKDAIKAEVLVVPSVT